jgi:hypothetical protein
VLKKTKHILTFILLFLVGGNHSIFAQGGPPGGGGGVPVCWPPSTCETPINNELVILLIAGFLLAFYCLKRNNRQDKSVV